MTISTLTPDETQRITDYLDAHPVLSVGVGTAESACSVAAINLALTGELTDKVPACMSEVIGRWIIGVQDAMAADIRNSPEWRDLLPLAAGTGRNLERERLAVILDWMWGTVLPVVQRVADANGFGTEWGTMLTERTADAAWAARDAAGDAAYATEVAAYAAGAAARTAARTAAAAGAARDAARDAWDAAQAAAWAADAAARDAGESAWRTFDPVGLLAKLIEVEQSA
jgi:hypothetical protein